MDFIVQQGCIVVVLLAHHLLIWICNLKNIFFSPQMWELQISVVSPWLRVLVSCIISKFLTAHYDLLQWQVMKVESWNLKSGFRPKTPQAYILHKGCYENRLFCCQIYIKKPPQKVNCHNFILQRLRTSSLTTKRCLAWSLLCSLFYIMLWCSDPLFLYSDVFQLCKILTTEL